MLSSSCDSTFMLSKPAVCHSSPFFRQSPFRRFRQKRQHQIQVKLFDEIVEMEIV
jgi:hypothetical protein